MIRTAISRIGIASGYLAALALSTIEQIEPASFIGPAVVTAATGYARSSAGGALLAAGLFAGAAGLGTYGAIVHLLGPAYPEVQTWIDHSGVPVAITFAFAVVAWWDP